MTPQQQIETYLSSLSSHLVPMTLAEREDILREIGAHIRDSVEETGAPVETVLTRLGPPGQLAAQYRDGVLIRAASRSLSPVLLLTATMRLASKGFVGIFVFFCGVFGYLTGAGFIVAAFIKPFRPASTGVFFWSDAAGNHVRIGSYAQSLVPPAHEITGWWFIPAALLAGSIAIAITTIIIREFLRFSQRWQSRLGDPRASPNAAPRHAGA